MNVRGSRTVDSPRADVFSAICDPSTLLEVIPGCRAIERVGDTEYRGLISLRLPGSVGTYRTLVRLVESDEPSFGRMEGSVEGPLGAITGSASFWLTDVDGGTTIDYSGQAAIGGPLARLDNRWVEGLASSLIDQGLGNLDARLRRVRTLAPSEDRGATRETPA
ncbi:MAG TPA: SRPBCC domain-containing protein [Candidatus Limnocylindrales bacterium]